MTEPDPTLMHVWVFRNAQPYSLYSRLIGRYVAWLGNAERPIGDQICRRPTARWAARAAHREAVRRYGPGRHPRPVLREPLAPLTERHRRTHP